MTKISSKKIEGLKVLVFICVEALPTVYVEIWWVRFSTQSYHHGDHRRCQWSESSSDGLNDIINIYSNYHVCIDNEYTIIE